MLPNLIGSIAIASAVAFGGAVSNAKQDQVHFGAESTSVKSAYYDPNGEYGTQNTYTYNYSGETLVSPNYDSGWQFITLEGSAWRGTQSSGDEPNIILVIDEDWGVQTFAFTEVKSFDVYLNGVYNNTCTFDQTFVQSDFTLEGYYTGNFTIVVEADFDDWSFESHYVWIFDHQEIAEDVNIVGDIAEGLTGGIVPIAQGLGSGFQDLMRNIFLVGHVDATSNEWVADGLSTFGIAVVCFAGLALALGLSRWIVNFVGSLGARDR